MKIDARWAVGLVVIGAGAGAFAGTWAPAAGPEARATEGGVFEGFCEASAILPWGDGYVVADNETDDRLYLLSADLQPKGELTLTEPVEDIEALALGPSGELVVVGSQSANKKGKPQPERERVLVQGGAAIRPDLSGCEACVAARGLPPKEGGLSVEGAAVWEGALWLGVRSPLVGGDALLLRVAGDPARALSVAETVPLDLDGYGVRDLLPVPGALLVLAGPIDGTDAPHHLYRLTDPGSPPQRLAGELPPGSEGLVRVGREVIVVTDGDGKPGEACKVPAGWARVTFAE